MDPSVTAKAMGQKSHPRWRFGSPGTGQRAIVWKTGSRGIAGRYQGASRFSDVRRRSDGQAARDQDGASAKDRRIVVGSGDCLGGVVGVLQHHADPERREVSDADPGSLQAARSFSTPHNSLVRARSIMYAWPPSLPCSMFLSWHSFRYREL